MLQIGQGVVFRSYEVVVDRMTVLRGNKSEENALFGTIPATSAPVISIVMFRCGANLIYTVVFWRARRTCQ